MDAWPTTCLPLASELLHACAREAQTWLLDAALPFWSEHGVDRQSGGFHHLLAPDGTVVASPKRTFVQCRQIYVFAQAGVLGWQGPWREFIAHGLDFLHGHCLTATGAFRRVPDSAACDLYDQAFAAFALAHAARALNDPDLREQAAALIRLLLTQWRLPQGGFANDDAQSPVFSQNPHMHLLEAMLAMCEHLPSAEDIAQHARDLLSFAQARFIDPASDTLLEHFGPDWTPASDTFWEPGHHFEWVWLIERASALLGVDSRSVARRLWNTAVDHGIDGRRDVAVDAVAVDGRPRSVEARLWPQAERLRAAVVLYRTGDASGDAEVVRAWESMRRYLDRAGPGTFFDAMAPDGTFDNRPVRASSLYHLVGAITELVAVAAQPLRKSVPDSLAGRGGDDRS